MVSSQPYGITMTTRQHADLKMAHSVTPLENPLQIRQARRTVARLATELTNRENQ
ncbi:MAG: 50S ribosomal protein L29 [Bacteroidota bacterium]